MIDRKKRHFGKKPLKEKHPALLFGGTSRLPTVRMDLISKLNKRFRDSVFSKFQIKENGELSFILLIILNGFLSIYRGQNRWKNNRPRQNGPEVFF